MNPVVCRKISFKFLISRFLIHSCQMKVYKEVIFWIVVLGLLVVVFGYRIHDYSAAFLFTTFMMPVLIGASYTFSEFLIPKFLLQKKYAKFILYSVYCLIISLNLSILVMVLSFMVIANYRYDNMLPASRDVFGLAIIILFIALVKSSWKLVSQLFNQEGELKKYAEKEELQTAGFLNVKANRKEYRLPLQGITYIESLADYIKINQDNGETVITREKISSISERIPANFLRIHRSYLVNIDYNTDFTAESVCINDTILPIGRKYKPEVMKVLKKTEA